MAADSTLKAYYRLAKPGIVYGNAVSVVAGFFLASQRHFNLGLFVAALAGISLVMASGCVFNNYIDRDIDGLMKRTRNRPLVTGRISGRHALVYGFILGLAGFALLAAFTNLLTTAIALVGFVFYVAVYGFWKRRSEYGTLVGSISGAVPPVVGYCAVANRLDAGAIILFFILVCWQMPHFYAIAIFRADDYAAARLPVLPVKRGIPITKIQTIFYIVAFALVSALLTLYGYTGYLYLLVIIALSVAWLRLAFQGFKTDQPVPWARRLFRFSLILLVVQCTMIALSAYLP